MKKSFLPRRTRAAAKFHINAAHKPTKRHRPRGHRPRAKIVSFAALLIAAGTAMWVLHSFRPALLLDAGHFLWEIKSATIELSFAIIAVGLSKCH